ncbi:hypothetical protein [Pseudomonas aeruginosa]|uniref:hypothetical protein n=1 Tax=Pseudomonas aeruginosa TaxID=287 RepID=UPI0012FD293A|nr:hypothetical protein [Pseudomonas aeruginosa]
MSIDWSKAPEGCIGAFARIISKTAFFVFSKRPSDYSSREGYEGEGEDGPYHVFSEYWEWIDKPWDGQGLPPVGAEVEANFPVTDTTGTHYHWRRVIVAVAGIPGAERECLVYDAENTKPAWVDELRPIRTPEQIAAEEREKAINQMISDAGYVDPKIGTFVAMGNLYDAGYRRQESST